jgi:hypothetical protein
MIMAKKTSSQPAAKGRTAATLHHDRKRKNLPTAECGFLMRQEAWSSWHSAVSRPFPKPTSGRSAVKVIHHRGDKVMKGFAV